MEVTMFKVLSALLLLLTAFSVSRAQDKGFCPPTTPPLVSQRSTQKTADGSSKSGVMILAVISDTGSVCSAKIIHGPDDTTNKKALEAVRKWRFEPARKDGKPVPVSVRVMVTIDRDGRTEPVPQ